MDTTVDRMKLTELLERYKIYTIRDFAEKTGLGRQHAWSLWHGQTGVGLATVKLLHERLKIPLEELIELDPPSNPKPRKQAPASSKKRGKRKDTDD